MWAEFGTLVKSLDIARENMRLATKVNNEAKKESEKCISNLRYAEENLTEADKKHNELSNDFYENFHDIIKDEENQ